MGLSSYYVGLNAALSSGINNPGVSTSIQTISNKVDKASCVLSFMVEGVREDDIAVITKDGQLIIELEKEYDPTKVAHTNWDKSYGIFTRYMDLPEDADTASLKKSVANGILTVELARSGAPAKTSKKAPAQIQPEATL